MASQAVIQKSRGGCLTCKRRRVKCDQGKPACSRCWKANLLCEGYSLFVISNRHLPESAAPRQSRPSPERVFADFQASETELQAYTAYQNRAVSFGEPIDTTFWHDLVLQVGNCEPAIRYCIFAIGSVTQHIQENGLKSVINDCRCNHCRFALTSYNKAIANITDPALPGDRTEVALLACVMFICFEMLQGSNERILNLVEQGCRLIRQTNRYNATRPASKSSLTTVLYPIFGRLRLLAHLFGRPISQLQDIKPRLLQHPSVLDELRNDLHEITGNLHPFLVTTTLARWANFANSDIIELCSQQNKQISVLNVWYSSFKQYCSSSPTNESPEQDSAKAILQVNYIVANIWLSTALSISQEVFDTYYDEFSHAIDLSASTLESPFRKRNSTSFTFEAGFMPILFFIASKCRHPALRKRAAALIALTGIREAAWDRAEILAVARRVIELEESGGEGEAEHWQGFPRNSLLERRFEDVQIGPSLSSAGKLYVHVTYFWMDTSNCLVSNKETLEITDTTAQTGG